MQRFPEFLKIVRRQWPRSYAIKYDTCQMEYEACLARGCSEEEIVEGTRYWIENCVPQDTSDFPVPAAHNWLRERSFLAYQPEEKRPRLEVV